MGTYSYSGLSGVFPGTPVFVTVATTGTYDVNAFGAQGGNSAVFSTVGGKGAEVDGRIRLTAGQKLKIVVGGEGLSSAYGGGGGGTFLLGDTGAGYHLLLAAGGGGGAFKSNGFAGSVTAAGNGSGGSAPYAGGGSGVKSNGQGSHGASGGSNNSGNYAGGGGNSTGGFGGGGGASRNGGGGGGGYTGGAGGNAGINSGGGGGTSFDSGTNVVAHTLAGVQAGNGSLTLTLEPDFLGAHNFTGNVGFVTVDKTGFYNIDAFGAQGGSVIRGMVGGKGAEEAGKISLTLGEKLEIVIGQAGGSSFYSGGGGGGTFLLGNTGAGYQLLLAAGGGGGADYAGGGIGSVTTKGNGSGGVAKYAGGGSGVKGDGARYGAAGSYNIGLGGSNASGNYAGGSANVSGGFGGGGAGSGSGGGGGGGYTGGSGGGFGKNSGGGGTSFDSGAAIAARTQGGAGSGNGSLTITVACYCAGTLILTSRGEMPVEILAIGDLVVTASGERRPIKWIGRRSYGKDVVSRHPHLRPIRIAAGAIASQVPTADLFVSPLHALLIDGVLVPAIALANGISILPVPAETRIDYVHLELETHDVILANGAAAETFIDDDSRAMFVNASEYHRLYPSAAGCLPRCAPLLDQGAALEAIRDRLAIRARRTRPDGSQATQQALLGQLDLASHDRLVGWALNPAEPDKAIELLATAGGELIARITAGSLRPDLQLAGLGQGRNGFDVALPALPCDMRHEIRICRAADGVELPGSPVTLEPEAQPPRILVRSPATLRGHVESVAGREAIGWAFDECDPEAKLEIVVSVDGHELGRGLANQYRVDLIQAGLGDGRHGFRLSYPALTPISRHIFQIRRASDGTELPGSPITIGPLESDLAMEAERLPPQITSPPSPDPREAPVFLLPLPPSLTVSV